MVISINYNLIPYPGHHYPVPASISKNAMSHPDAGQKSIGIRSRFQRPHSEKMAGSIHFSVPANRYDGSRRLQSSDAELLGRLIDIYA